MIFSFNETELRNILTQQCWEERVCGCFNKMYLRKNWKCRLYPTETLASSKEDFFLKYIKT